MEHEFLSSIEVELRQRRIVYVPMHVTIYPPIEFRGFT